MPTIVVVLALLCAGWFAPGPSRADDAARLDLGAPGERSRARSTAPRRSATGVGCAAPVRVRSREPRAETGAGFTVGPIGGIGFAYRSFDRSGWGFQVGGLAYADSYTATVVFGAQRMKTLRVAPRSRFYALAGAMYVYTREEVEVATGPWPVSGAQPIFVRQRRNSSSTNVGAGLGISTGRSDGVVAALELPLVMLFKDGFRLDSVMPIPQVVLAYNF